MVKVKKARNPADAFRKAERKRKRKKDQREKQLNREKLSLKKGADSVQEVMPVQRGKRCGVASQAPSQMIQSVSLKHEKFKPKINPCQAEHKLVLKDKSANNRFSENESLKTRLEKPIMNHAPQQTEKNKISGSDKIDSSYDSDSGSSETSSATNTDENEKDEKYDETQLKIKNNSIQKTGLKKQLQSQVQEYLKNQIRYKQDKTAGPESLPNDDQVKKTPGRWDVQKKDEAEIIPQIKPNPSFTAEVVPEHLQNEVSIANMEYNAWNAYNNSSGYPPFPCCAIPPNCFNYTVYKHPAYRSRRVTGLPVSKEYPSYTSSKGDPTVEPIASSVIQQDFGPNLRLMKSGERPKMGTFIPLNINSQLQSRDVPYHINSTKSSSWNSSAKMSTQVISTSESQEKVPLLFIPTQLRVKAKKKQISPPQHIVPRSSGMVPTGITYIEKPVCSPEKHLNNKPSVKDLDQVLKSFMEEVSQSMT